MKKRLLLITTVLIVISVSFFAYRLRHPSQAIQLAPVYVAAMPLKESVLPLEVQAIGSLKAKQVDISPEMPGHIRQIAFTDGLFVEKDTQLIKLDDAVYKAKYQSAKAQLAYSQSDYQRKVYLGKKGAIAQQAIEQAESDLKEKKATVDEAAVLLEKMTLKAPFAGMIGKSNVNLGDYVTNGQRLVTLTDTKHLRVEYEIPEQFYPLIKKGQQVTLSSATYPDKTFAGKISYISPTINPENRSVSLYAEIDNSNNQLTAGMFVQVTQLLGQNKHALLVPARSLVPILDGEQIYKIQDGKAYPVTVTIGKHFNENVEILAGLSVGDVIVTDGQLKIKNGTPVKIKN